MIDPARSVCFVCSGGKGTEAEINTVMSLWRDMLDSYSPGSEYQTEYLSRKHLENTKKLKQLAAYSENEIKKAKAAKVGANTAVKEIVGNELIQESLGNLLVIFPCMHTFPFLPVSHPIVAHPSVIVKAVIA